MADDRDRYLLPNAEEAAAERFEAFIELFDPSTFAHMERLGLAPGWRCWEVGAGGDSVVRWLAQRVGPHGHVLATDIDITRTIAGATDADATNADATARASAPVEVRAHDVAHDPPPDLTFDLVHARLVLVHIPEREKALAAMVGALRPGGWLFVEDADPALQPLSSLEVRGPAQELANRLRSGFRELMASRGVDLAYGRTLPRLLREAGLEDVRADAAFPVAHPACSRLETATIHLIAGQLLEHGIATVEEIELHLANVAAGRLDLTQPPMIAAWGRRPL
jgi:SAM-dependent methyltransferase